MVSCCISFDSYTKPQPLRQHHHPSSVVYLLIPTPNHNALTVASVLLVLYIFWFLHQTTTAWLFVRSLCSCISFDSYTKPQPSGDGNVFFRVVYLLIPTPNHNAIVTENFEYFVVYLLIPTPNHNQMPFCILRRQVVYLLIPTSSHNSNMLRPLPFLVVYLLIPTSNHNLAFIDCINLLLYIFWFLHQTTTYPLIWKLFPCCISFDSYIKPQHKILLMLNLLCCISFDSYIKPQPCW